MNRNTKGQIFLIFFRSSAFFTKNRVLLIIGFPIRILYLIIVQWILGIDIPDRTKIGKKFNVFHGQGLIVNSSTIFGDNVTVRQNSTIGNAKPEGGSPIIGDNVDIGANSVVIGAIKIGDNSIIGAGSVVIRDVPPNTVVAGNPAKEIKVVNTYV